MDSHSPSASTHRDGRLVVCRLASDAVQTANQTIEDVFRQVVIANHAATAAPPITDMVSVHDRETKAFHLLLVHRLDYRRKGAPAIGDVVVFSEPTYAVFRTERLQLATPAYYRRQEDLSPGIRDVRDGTLTRDSIQWAKTVVPAGMVTSSSVSFASSREPWVYCASHSQLDRKTGSTHMVDRARGSPRRRVSRANVNTASLSPRSATRSSRNTTSTCRRSCANSPLPYGEALGQAADSRYSTRFSRYSRLR